MKIWYGVWFVVSGLLKDGVVYIVDGFLYSGNVMFQCPTVLHHQAIFFDFICMAHLFDKITDLCVVHDMSEGKLFGFAHDIVFVFIFNTSYGILCEENKQFG